eukprot:Blabericola_migrator_1__5683@NODE_2887_length_2239_cov_77_952118_g1811_i0_p1_GENE_NODE_2887_length_2239_cov_77_952118_g1811_i0NODE_2887_length_2239_cov_77_952118_g1811_i0_p1_ORF_typecomplete_len509_score103_86ABA_GPCR/PF12430_8/6_1e03ABA_GPCR/PF12430_8/7_4e35GPHR_N/PF12537_8/5_7e09DUF3681/PF12442_8/0_32DUF3681/PF12442_8/2_4e03_NODE_2887_length_2239_cov_77_952118_g1811_i03311857
MGHAASVLGVVAGHALTLLAAKAFSKGVFHDHQDTAIYIYIVSSTAAVCGLFAILAETFPFSLDKRVISTALRCDLFTMVLVVWFIVPTYLTKLIASKWLGKNKMVPIVMAVWVSLSCFFAQLGTLVNVPRLSVKFDHIVARVAMGGVCIGSILTGYGSIQFPLENLRLLFTSVSRSAIANLERRLLAVLKLRRQKNRQISTLTSEYHLDLPRTPESRAQVALKRGFTFEVAQVAHLLDDEESGGLSYDTDDSEEAEHLNGYRVQQAETHDGSTRSADTAPPSRRTDRARALGQIAGLQAEVSSLDALAIELMNNLNEMRAIRSMYLRSQTLKGRVLNAIAWTMVGACIYRVTTAVVNVTFRRTPEIDPATKAINTVLNFVHLDLDVEYWATLLSLVYVGYIVYGTITGFGQKIKSLVEMSSNRIGMEMMVLGITEIQTLYFCACTLLLRANLPPQRREIITQVLGESLAFGEFYLQSDFVFIISSLLSVVLAAVAVRSRTWKARKEL